MPAYVDLHRTHSPRQRFIALVAVIGVQGLLGLALLLGLRVSIPRSAEAVEQLIDLSLPQPAAVPPVERKAAKSARPLPQAARASASAAPGPLPSPVPPSITPVTAVLPNSAPSGGSGLGPASGDGSGDGSGGQGVGAADGGSELEQIAGEITPRDYPRHLGRAGIGGRVGLLFTVGVNGRVTRCSITRSSGVPELDALTCRLIQQRFVFRPATDRSGRPVSDEVEGEHVWDVDGRN